MGREADPLTVRGDLATHQMNGLRKKLRSFGPFAVLATVLLLTGALWITGVHHHEPATGHSCPVCITAHSPAIITISITGVVAPCAAAVHFVDAGDTAPVTPRLGIAPSRAPPLA
jgi:hypothetical protein